VNHAASVRDKLVSLAKKSGQEAGILFLRYALKRFLHRLGASEYRARFVLKGAMRLLALGSEFRRTTKDLDLLGFGNQGQLLECIHRCCTLTVPEDGVVFDASTIKLGPIRQDLEYGGWRVNLIARLGSAVLPLQIDVGYGDAVTPPPEDILYPSLLEYPAPQIRAYPVETIIAEKLHAICVLGMGNTRLKDYYDLYWIAQTFSPDKNTLHTALERTFASRQTPMPQYHWA
jgi:predicted nucleotidyltransferase component of viral defense system